MKTERDNAKWKERGLWHFSEAESLPAFMGATPYGHWVTKGQRSWRFWCLTPSAAYWLAAQLNAEYAGRPEGLV